MIKFDRNSILKAKVVLLIAVVMILSIRSVTADTNEQIVADEDWIYYDNGFNEDALGLVLGGTFEFAIRITPAELTEYDGWKLTTVRHHHGGASDPAPFTTLGNIKIYGTGTPILPGPLINSEPFTVTELGWFDVQLSTPVTINASEEYWVSIEVTNALCEYPAGVDTGPAIDEKGGWLYTEGFHWTELQDVGWDANFMIRAKLEEFPASPDLDCDGSLSWTDIEPGANITGTFTVENIGDPGTLLDWEISEYPDWGTWRFIPTSGDDLTPEDGPVMVEVQVVAPDESNEEFTGEVKVINVDDPDDYCIIEVSLSTPVNQHSVILQLLQRIIQRFPILEQIFLLFPIFNRILNLQ